MIVNKYKEMDIDEIMMRLSKLSKEFEECEDEYNKIIKLSPSIFNTKLKFVSGFDSKIKYNTIIDAQEYIDRYTSVDTLSNTICDINIAIGLEAGIFEFALVYVLVHNLNKNLVSATYYDKFNDIVRLLDKKTSVYSKRILSQLYKNKIDPQCLAFMSPQEIDPGAWEILIKKRDLMEYKKNNMATTDLYQCYRCKKRRCTVTLAQLRGADEQISCMVQCLVCHNKWQAS